jgi:hypothetical protein
MLYVARKQYNVISLTVTGYIRVIRIFVRKKNVFVGCHVQRNNYLLSVEENTF